MTSGINIQHIVYLIINLICSKLPYYPDQSSADTSPISPAHVYRAHHSAINIWPHDMEMLYALLALCEANPSVTGTSLLVGGIHQSPCEVIVINIAHTDNQLGLSTKQRHDVNLVQLLKLEQLERLRSEIPPAAPWLPILVIHIRSQVQRRQSQI